MADRKPNRRSTIFSGLALLEVLLDAKEGRGVSDLARAIDMDIGQTHRLLAALGDAAYVRHDAQAGTYRLTPKIVQLAGRFLKASDLVSVARPYMELLRNETGETVHLAASVAGSLPVCVARELSPHPVAVASEVGQSFSYETTAIGRAIREATEGNRRGAAAGYAIDREQHRPGVVAVASATFDLSGQVTGALAVSGPAFRLRGKRAEALAPLVRRTALAVSEDLGYTTSTESEAIGR